jgi:hypothetical protein
MDLSQNLWASSAVDFLLNEQPLDQKILIALIKFMGATDDTGLLY